MFDAAVSDTEFFPFMPQSLVFVGNCGGRARLATPRGVRRITLTMSNNSGTTDYCRYCGGDGKECLATLRDGQSVCSVTGMPADFPRPLGVQTAEAIRAAQRVRLASTFSDPFALQFADAAREYLKDARACKVMHPSYFSRNYRSTTATQTETIRTHVDLARRFWRSALRQQRSERS